MKFLWLILAVASYLLGWRLLSLAFHDMNVLAGIAGIAFSYLSGNLAFKAFKR